MNLRNTTDRQPPTRDELLAFGILHLCALREDQPDRSSSCRFRKALEQLDLGLTGSERIKGIQYAMTMAGMKDEVEASDFAPRFASRENGSNVGVGTQAKQ